MKTRWSLLLVLLGGCAPTADFSGPAPAGALECASAHALAAGYLRIDGSVEESFLRLAQPIRSTPARARPTQPTPDLGDVALGNVTDPQIDNAILARVEDGRLFISILKLNEITGGGSEGTDADQLARSVLALCTADPPIMPGDSGSLTEPRQPGEPL